MSCGRTWLAWVHESANQSSISRPGAPPSHAAPVSCWHFGGVIGELFSPALHYVFAPHLIILSFSATFPPLSWQLLLRYLAALDEKKKKTLKNQSLKMPYQKRLMWFQKQFFFLRIGEMKVLLVRLSATDFPGLESATGLEPDSGYPTHNLYPEKHRGGH